MIDREWLEKVVTAYNYYPKPSEEVESFVKWLYQQYGIVVPNSIKSKNSKH